MCEMMSIQEEMMSSQLEKARMSITWGLVE